MPRVNLSTTNKSTRDGNNLNLLDQRSMLMTQHAKPHQQHVDLLVCRQYD